MTTPELKSSGGFRGLAIAYCVFGVLQGLVGVVYFFLNDEFTSFFLEKLLVELPEIEGVVTFVLWVFIALINVLIFIAAIFMVIAWQILAPVISLMSVPSIVGGVGTLYKKEWAVRILYYTSMCYALIFFPWGVVMTVLTVRQYRRRKVES